VKVRLGDFYTKEARQLAKLIREYANDELRFTLRQNFLIRDVKEELVPFFYQELKKLGLADYGYNTIGDITACPGTDTCNLGIASSTGAADVMGKVILDEYPEFLLDKHLTIKISGCMNACGQHNMASIGFQGMSMKVGKSVLPALQVLLGGAMFGDGKGRFSDKVIKIPSKRGPQALRVLLDDYKAQAEKGENYARYYERQGQMYFYELLKPLAGTDTITESDFIDWGNEEPYVKAIGVGECAGVVIDLVSTLLLEAREKLADAEDSLKAEKWADGIYQAYTCMVNAAKAILTAEGVNTNSYASIVSEFEAHFIDSGKIDLGGSFSDLVYEIKQHSPTADFAREYYQTAEKVYEAISEFRSKEVHA
jgi:sulfite reductase (ferredoxin)